MCSINLPNKFYVKKYTVISYLIKIILIICHYEPIIAYD